MNKLFLQDKGFSYVDQHQFSVTISQAKQLALKVFKVALIGTNMLKWWNSAFKTAGKILHTEVSGKII